MAYGYINYTAMLAAVAGLPACSVKTVDEASGVPSIQSHMETYRSANWLFNVMRAQKWEVNEAEVRLETEMTVKAVSAILDKVLELGDGDICVGTVKAIEAGVLDSPFSINSHPRDLCLGVRDLQGACRYLDFGNIPVPEEVKEYHREKLRERELAEGSKLGFSTSIADFWCLSRGQITGKPEVSPYEAEARSFIPEIKAKQPTVITGTVGVDSHVIGTKIVSRVLNQYGFRVVALGAQTSPEDFIKAAQETDACAMLISSLYGMAEMDCLGFRDKCVEAGVGDILLYIGGILGVGVRDFAEDEAKFKDPKIGFDRVYPPETDVERDIVDLCKDLRAKGLL
jgi:methylaspartate mutase S subunit